MDSISETLILFGKSDELSPELSDPECNIPSSELFALSGKLTVQQT
jgi:hypothetical protein